MDKEQKTPIHGDNYKVLSSDGGWLRLHIHGPNGNAGILEIDPEVLYTARGNGCSFEDLSGYQELAAAPLKNEQGPDQQSAHETQSRATSQLPVITILRP